MMYSYTMKKRTKPLNKANEARRKAESQALFNSMLKAKHTVVIPKKYKGTRAEKLRNAIDNG